jgi:hypothetical protein
MDYKVTDLDQATQVASSDILYLIQNSTDTQVTLGALLGAIPFILGAKGLAFNSTPNAMGGAGTVDLTTAITTITGGSSPYSVTLGNPSSSIIKIIVGDSISNTVTINGSFAGFSNLQFRESGNSAILLYVNAKWYLLGGKNYTA